MESQKFTYDEHSDSKESILEEIWDEGKFESINDTNYIQHQTELIQLRSSSDVPLDENKYENDLQYNMINNLNINDSYNNATRPYQSVINNRFENDAKSNNEEEPVTIDIDTTRINIKIG